MTLYLQHEFYKTGANEELHEKPFSLYGPTCSFLILDKLNEAGIFSPNNDFMWNSGKKLLYGMVLGCPLFCKFQDSKELNWALLEVA